MTEHIVTSFEGQLQNLHNTIIKMGALAESQFSSSITALQKSDQDLVDKIIGKDDRVDEFEKKNRGTSNRPYSFAPTFGY